MSVLQILIRAAVSPIEVMNDIKMKGKFHGSVIIVILTAFFGSAITPVIDYFYSINSCKLSAVFIYIAVLACLSVLTWLVACAVLYLISRLFKKKVSFSTISSTWGLSYLPNLICVIAYGIVQMKFKYFISNILVAAIINTFFIVLLIWKAILYFIEMKFVIKTSAKELLIATIISGILFIVLMGLGFAAGIQVPML